MISNLTQLPDVRSSGRAMKKLLKEANKVKTVLSANTETWSQVESLHQDKDFRAKVTRAEMEALFSDLYPRFRWVFSDLYSKFKWVYNRL